MEKKVEIILVGLLGVLLGFLLSDYIKRKARIEEHYDNFFKKRLNTYQNLGKKISTASTTINQLESVTDMTIDVKKARAFHVSSIVLEFVDDHALYLNDEIVEQCKSTFQGVSEMYIEEFYDDLLVSFDKQINNIKCMIRNDLLTSDVDKLFTMANSTSGIRVIEGFRNIDKMR